MNQERIIELAVKKLRGTLTPEEATELEQFEQTASPEERSWLGNAMEHEKRLVRVLRLMRLAQTNYQANRKNVPYPTDERRGMLRRLWAVPGKPRVVGVAAAVFALMAGAIIWKKMAFQPAERVIAETEQATSIKPISNKAVLVLADGRTVVLDSAASGKIALQGGTAVTKDADGKLSYQPLSNTAAVGFNTVNTPQGGQYYVELPDGTRVWLNAASSIRFPTAFTGAERSVAITGEAYLEVAKDQHHPFEVTLGGTIVRVLGTHFNVKNYPEDGGAATTLLEGAVKVAAAGKEALLKPGQAAITETAGIRVDPYADTALAVAWKNGYLSFEGSDITLIMNQIKRWYDVDVVFEGSKSLYRIQGKIPKNSSINDVLKILVVAGYRFSIKGKTIHVLP